MQHACFDIHGWQLAIGADSPDLLQDAESFLQNFRVAATPNDPWRLSLERGDLQEDDRSRSLHLIWSGVIPSGIAAANYAAPGLRRFDLPGRGRCLLDFHRREARLTLAPQMAAGGSRYFLTALLCAGLSRVGHVPLHAACLIARKDERPCSVLLVAPSGTGKSTTAYGLTSGGYQLMGDDLSLLQVTGERIAAWGFPRQCHVRRPTLDLLPWLRTMPLIPTGIEDTWQFPLASLGPRAAEPRQRPLPTGLVVILQKPNPRGHRCEAIDSAGALASLCQENIHPTEGHADRDAAAAFAALGRLALQTPAIYLSAGPDVEHLAEFLAAETGVTP
jgi:hypothetical protein